MLLLRLILLHMVCFTFIFPKDGLDLDLFFDRDAQAAQAQVVLDEFEQAKLAESEGRYLQAFKLYEAFIQGYSDDRRAQLADMRLSELSNYVDDQFVAYTFLKKMMASSDELKEIAKFTTTRQAAEKLPDSKGKVEIIFHLAEWCSRQIWRQDCEKWLWTELRDQVLASSFHRELASSRLNEIAHSEKKLRRIRNLKIGAWGTLFLFFSLSLSSFFFSKNSNVNVKKKGKGDWRTYAEIYYVELKKSLPFALYLTFASCLLYFFSLTEPPNLAKALFGFVPFFLLLSLAMPGFRQSQWPSASKPFVSFLCVLAALFLLCLRYAPERFEWLGR